MLRYLTFITIGILLYLLLNIYNKFNIGAPNLEDLNEIFPDDEYDDKVTSGEDEFGAGIPREFFDQGLRLNYNNIIFDTTLYEVGWYYVNEDDETDIIFISAVEILEYETTGNTDRPAMPVDQDEPLVRYVDYDMSQFPTLQFLGVAYVFTTTPQLRSRIPTTHVYFLRWDGDNLLIYAEILYRTIVISLNLHIDNLDNTPFFHGDFLTDGIADTDFDRGFRNFNYFYTDIGNMLPPDPYGLQIPQRIHDVGRIYVPDNFDNIDIELDIQWLNQNTIFISPIDRGINYDDPNPTRIDMYETYTINGIVYRVLNNATLSRFPFNDPDHQYNPILRYRLVNDRGYTYIYEGNTQITRIFNPDRRAYRDLQDWCAAIRA